MQELSWFVAGLWVQLRHPGDEQSMYWYNPVLGIAQWEEPSAPQLLPLDDSGTQLLLEDDSSFVMPSRSALQGAGRWDLHHAIVRHGGYRQALPTPHPRPLPVGLQE